ncbi:MAG: hypothetical protein M5U23_10255 [Acidimicrobiia bacterium]|nr:hypothetical protein [Acidimicrobiia bacterium]
MDIETLISVMSEEERSELLARLTNAAGHSEGTADDSEDSFGCCGGPRSMAQRRMRMIEMRNEMRNEMRKMCCGAS